MTTEPWWTGAVVYQIYPRSFCDVSGDGVGDLAGIEQHLDHLQWLGVDALWLSPIFPSPMADHGYDVADYCDVDPLFGSLADLDRLVAAAHSRDLRVLLDWVPNHSSDAHPWFVASRSSRDDPHRDWYIWVDGTPDHPPNGWQRMFPPGPAWTWDPGSEAWYYHRYTAQQPDLNWANPEVQVAMHDTLRFWLDRGIDGFRMDVIHQIGKDPDRWTPAGLAEGDAPNGPTGPSEPERTHELLRGIRKLIDGYDGDRVAVGEVYILDVEQVASYLGADAGELHLAFNFVPLFLPWEAEAWRGHLADAARAFEPRGAWPTWALSSHDIPRQRTRLGSEAKARAAVVLLLGLRGTPFLYAGEELGLEDAVVPPELVQDPAGFRDGCRAPIPWDSSSGHGWAGATPWLPWPPDPGSRNAATLRDDPTSILHLYRRLLTARRNSPALQHGTQRVLPASAPDVLAWERTTPGDRRLIAVNFAPDPRPLSLDTPWTTEVSSTGTDEGRPFPGTLAPHQAALLRPT
ncbi:MAG TPA: alpha-amylase family glycosyl hydrolase [Acidimicrobiales bacterium]|jgi:alpha-glucosidase